MKVPNSQGTNETTGNLSNLSFCGGDADVVVIYFHSNFK